MSYIQGPVPDGTPPIGAAGGDLAGTYPNPTLNTSISTAVAFSGLGATTISQQGASASALTLTGGTVTTSQPLINATQTWNAGGTAFVARNLIITNTASAANSIFDRIRVGTSDIYRVVNAWNGGGNPAMVLGSGTIGSNELSMLFIDSASGGPVLGFAVGGTTLFGSYPSGLLVRSDKVIAFNNAAALGTVAPDVFVTRGGAATLTLGNFAADTTGVSQTLQAQGVTVGGTANQAGGSLTLQPGQGKGNVGASLIFKGATLGASGTTLQTMTEVARVLAATTNPGWQWSVNNSTGGGSAALGANCPASTLTAPYTWVQGFSSDGSVVYWPVWK